MWRLLDCAILLSPVVDTACIWDMMPDIAMIDAPNCMRICQLEVWVLPKLIPKYGNFSHDPVRQNQVTWWLIMVWPCQTWVMTMLEHYNVSITAYKNVVKHTSVRRHWTPSSRLCESWSIWKLHLCFSAFFSLDSMWLTGWRWRADTYPMCERFINSAAPLPLSIQRLPVLQ